MAQYYIGGFVTNIYSTGASGNLGSQLPRYVVPLKFSESGLNKSELQKINSGDTVLHLAAVVGEAKCMNDPDLATRINVFAARELAKQVFEIPNVRLIYVSTGHVYGSQSSARSEYDEINPQTFYANLKAQGESEVKKIFSTENDRLSIARIFSILDTGLAFNSLASRVIRILDNKEDSTHILNSDDIRDFQSRSEIILMLEKVWHFNFEGEINICSGRQMSVKEACLDFAHKIGIPGGERILKFSPGVSAIPYLVGSRQKFDLLVKQRM